MEYYFAPMEGVTGALYRAAHNRHFAGTDKYYMPFLAPTQEHIFTPRELRNAAPEHNWGFAAVPQVLTKNADDFCWAAQALFEMGYKEVNLNLGCPSGTVTAKGKGAGMLADPDGLDHFLELVFSRLEGNVSLKTRLGMEDPEEFPRLLEIFNRYPVSLLIIHPRVRQDFYKHPIRVEAFAAAAESCAVPLCYNGGLVTTDDCGHFQKRFPSVDRVMIGQGLLADPALIRKAKGGAPAGREELRDFHDELYHSYLDAFGSQRNTVFHMKEFWAYLSRLFEGVDKPLKRVRKAADGPAYERAVDEIFDLPLRQDALWAEKQAVF